MARRLRHVLVFVAIGLAALAGPTAAAQADDAVNLVVTPTVRKGVRSAFVRTHSQYSPAKIKGPLKGSMYYARYRGVEWAIATFSVPSVGTTDQPEVFRRPLGGRWADRGDTGGELCKLPRAVVKVWGLLERYSGC